MQHLFFLMLNTSLLPNRVMVSLRRGRPGNRSRSISSGLILIFGIILSCSESDTPTIEIPTEDQEQFTKLASIAAAAEALWPGFNYLITKPAYIVMTDDDGQNPRGYLLNPPTPIPSGSGKLGESSSAGLTLYANDGYLDDAATILGPIGSFSFDELIIESVPYFLIREKKIADHTFYDSYKDGGQDHWLAVVMTHEVFHTYQIDSWTYPQNAVQDFFNYPLTADILTYELALFDLMSEAHSVQGSSAAAEALAKYVVLFEQMVALDPTAEQLVLNMGSFQQFLEGSARYVEHFSAQQSIHGAIGADPTHGWGTVLDNLTSGEQIRHILAVRIWYHVGAAAIHLLLEMNEPVEQSLKSGKTPFEIAVDALPLTGEEKYEILDGYYSSPDWVDYEDQADYLVGLL